MKLLLDTQLLLWAAAEPKRLAKDIREVIESSENEPLFSSANIWEIAAKVALGRPDFQVEPKVFRRALLENGYSELPITSRHAAAVNDLPSELTDLFDRILVAQSVVERIPLLTSDPKVARYSGLA
ncbi:MAG TPA: type II toxin-antitoxin system VapC family toxin [Rhizomicrobium sp.]|nr:type II toxin-antitoxin system VapC family toxin [Rhizomicrobium sp.]